MERMGIELIQLKGLRSWRTLATVAERLSLWDEKGA